MSGLKSFGATLALVIALAALVAGCGGDSKASSKKASSGGAGSQQKANDDIAAKRSARDLVAQMETCYVDQMSYASCMLTADGKVGGQPTGLGQGSGAGQVSSTGTAAGYVVTSKSKSGNTFVITKGGNGEVLRTCTTKGQGGCPAAGPSAGNDW
jgi:hypothetical protein